MEHNELIVELKDKVKTIISLYEAVKTEKEALLRNNEELVSRVETQNNEIEQLKKHYNNIKLAKLVSASSEDSYDAKLKINRLVREIDKCIALLNR